MDIPSICTGLMECAQSLKPVSSSTEITAQFNQSALLLVLLKKLNRTKLLQLDEKQHSVDTLKDRVNKSQLKLENLLYKQAYLLREINDFKDYNSTELNKIETELEMKIGMDEYSSDLVQLHKNSLSILKKELQLRKLKRSELQDLEKKKESLSDELNSKRKRLESFPEKVSKIKTLAKEVFSDSSSKVEGSESSTTAQVSLAEGDDMLSIHQLANPLYTLYHSLHSLKTANLGKVSVNIAENSGNWGVELTMSQQNLHLYSPDSDNSVATTGGTATVTIRFEHSKTNNLVCSTVSSLQFMSPSGSTLSPPGNPEKTLLKGMFPNKPASIDLMATADDACGAYLWVQWICGLRVLPPPSHGSNDGIDLFYSLNTVVDSIFSRMQTFWRLASIVKLLSSSKSISPTQPYPLPPVLQHYFDLSMQRLALATSASSQTPSHPSISHPLSTVDVKVQSLMPCEPPSRGQVNDPFVASTLLASSTHMETDEIENLRASSIFRPEDDREHCLYFKASILLTTTTVPSGGGKASGAQTHTETVIALIELSTQYPICPPQILLTSRKMPDNSSKAQGQQVDNMLKGIEQELNAGCVNFLDVPTIAKQVQVSGGTGSDLAENATKDVLKTISKGSLLVDAMDNILLLQVSMLIHMLAAVSATHSHNKLIAASSELSTDTKPEQSAVGSGGGVEDRRFLLSTFYGRNFTS